MCHTAVAISSQQTNPSLTLDFGSTVQLGYVAVYNRRDAGSSQDRLGDYTVSYRISSSDSWTVCSSVTAPGNGAADVLDPVMSDCQHLARYVMVQLPGSGRILNLAEVEAFSLPYCELPSFGFEFDAVGSCPRGWTCTGAASVQTEASAPCGVSGVTGVGQQFFAVGCGTQLGSAVSRAFTLPSNVATMGFLRQGSSPPSGLSVFAAATDTLIAFEAPLRPGAYPGDLNAWYCPGAFNIASSTWQDCSGNGNMATLSGSGLAELRSAGHGATSE
eukprot:scaffold35444_cov65-Phaeocystis_antarctica.AAC.1